MCPPDGGSSPPGQTAPSASAPPHSPRREGAGRRCNLRIRAPEPAQSRISAQEADKFRRLRRFRLSELLV